MSGNLKRSSSSRGGKKMTLAMLKGKPSNLSVPSIRFNTGDEDVEVEQNEWNKTTDENSVKRLSGSERWNAAADELKSTISKHSTLFSSISADAPKEVSPIVENLIKSNKRSTSLDSGATPFETSEPRSLFQELKGKITKTVEETLHIDLGVTQDSTIDDVAKTSTDYQNNAGSPEVGEEAFELLDGECPESRVPTAPSSRNTSDRLRQLSMEIKNRRARLLHRSDNSVSPAFTMSALVNQDQDALEEQLHSEYDQRTLDSWNQRQPSEEEYFLALPPPPPPSTTTTNPVNPFTSRQMISSNNSQWMIYAIGVVLLILVPLPPFITGLATGIALMILGMIIHKRYIAPRPRLSSGNDVETVDSRITSTRLQIPIVTVKPPEVHKGWMNELRQVYDSSNYHVSQTCPVFVRLEGSLLRISHPRNKIPRHASWNETSHETSFYHQRYYHLADSQLVLLPVGLTRKRIWSRKYPLCILLSDSACRTGHLCVSPTEDELGSDDNAVPSTSNSPTVTATSEECIYLFARTCREKEEWYWLFKEAMKKTVEQDQNSKIPMAPSPEATRELTTYMNKWFPTEEDASMTTETSSETPNDATWLNALLSRIFWDFLREPAWAEFLLARIQRKLSKIKVPYFMEELTLTALELGSQLPVIGRISSPTMDVRGLWVDVDVTYEGTSCVMTLETKLNLMKLKKETEILSPVEKGPARMAAFDSDEEDSAESSTDEDMDIPETCLPTDESGVNLSGLAASQGGGGTSKKILRFVDKITQSRYFQHATEYKYVRKAMQGVSNTRLILRVELQSLVGTLALNIPPPPTDRLWYGFRTNPKIVLVARPRLGEREVTVASVTEWIENKLVQELQKILVMPNMDDLVIPVMTSGLNYTNPTSQGGNPKT